MILYATDVSLYSAKVAIGLAHKGVACERRLPPGGSYRAPEYRALVPAGTVPAIDDDGFVLSESDAILAYVEETRPGPSLLPGDAKARARARYASRIHDFRIEPRVRALFPFVGGEAGRAGAAAAALREAMAGLEALIAPAPFAAGAAFSLGDCGWAPTFAVADGLLAALGEAPLAYPSAIAIWRDALAAVPAVRSVMLPYREALAAWIRSKTAA
ncbi:MAG: glutathione S-transferase N-terminal domain-containing protein [Rhodospirillaceae bacterium]|nr:glutathione S-transferase N-terminal domain-containing protein [Rhodospirillaceae bacterium]